MAGDNRIAVTKQDIKGYLNRVQQLKTPPELRTNRRNLNPKAGLDSVALSQPAVQPQELKLHPETPDVELFTPGIEQRAGNLTTLLALAPKGSKLAAVVREAIQEQKLLGASA